MCCIAGQQLCADVNCSLLIFLARTDESRTSACTCINNIYYYYNWYVCVYRYSIHLLGQTRDSNDQVHVLLWLVHQSQCRTPTNKCLNGSNRRCMDVCINIVL